MSITTRILVVEDNIADYDLALYEIRKVVQSCAFQRAEKQEDFITALQEFQPHIILSDYKLPGFDGIKVLELARQHIPFSPVIIWTGAMSEEMAVECMKMGASDYILKENVKQLGRAVLQALKESEMLLERRQAEEKYQAIFENSPIGIFQSTPQGQFLSVNPAMARIYGYASPEEMIHSITDISHQIYTAPEDRHEFTNLLDTQHVVQNFEWANTRKDGSVFWTSTSARTVCDEAGHVLYYEGFLQDITSRKEADERIVASEKRFRSLIENGMENISLLAKDGTLLWENPAIYRTLGYEAGQFLGQNIFQLMHPDDLEWISDLFAGLVKEPGKVQRATFRLKHLDGDWRWVEATATNMLAEPGVEAVVINYRDVTSRVETEMRIKDLLSLNEKMLNHSPLGILTYKVTGECVFANQNAATITGTTVEKLLSQNFHTAAAWKKSGLYTLVEKAIATKAAVSGDVHHSSTFGKEVWLAANCVTFKAGDEEHLLLSVADITERKQAEQDLKESQAKYKQLVETSHDLIWSVDAQGRISFINRAAKALYGYEPDELIGRPFFEFMDLEHYHSNVQTFQAEISETDQVQGIENYVLHRDGRRRILSANSIVIRDEDGNVVGVSGTSRDITEQKRAELERQAVLDIMQGLAITKDLQEFLQLVHHSLGNVIYAENFFVVLHQRDTGLFEEIYSVDEYDPPAPPSKLEKSITSHVFRSGEPLFLTSESFSELVEQGEIELVGTDSASWLGVPLKTPAGTIGVMAVQDYQNPNRYSESDKNFLASIASQVALAIERKQAETELQQKNNDLGLLKIVNDAVIQGRDLDSVMDLLSKELNRIFSTVGCTIYLFSADKQSLTMQQYAFSAETTRKIERLIGFAIPKIQIPIRAGGYFHRAMIARQSVITNDPKDIQDWIAEFVETRFLPPIAKTAIRRLIPRIYKLLNIRSTIIVPLIFGEEIIGFLDVSSSNLLTPNDLKRIESIGEQLTTVLQRQRANEKIRKSEEFLQGVQNSLSAHIAILDHTGNIAQVNSAWREFGSRNGLQSADSCIGMNYLDVCDATTGPDVEVAQKVAAAIRDVLSGEKQEASVEYACHGPQEKRWFTTHITCFDDGEQKWVILAHENITTRMVAETSLKEKTAQFLALFEASPDAIMLIDPQGDWPIVDCNSAACRMNGYTREELIGKSVDTLNSGPATVDGRSWYMEKLQEAEVFRYETTHIHKDGTVFPIEVSTSLIQIGDRTLVLGIDRDITERKRAEEELRQSENRYRTVVENQTEFIVRWKADGTRTFANEAYCTYFGISPEQALRTSFMSLVHEEDRPTVEQKASRLLSGGSLVETDAHRVIKPDGTIGWNEWTDHAIYDNNGQLVEIQSVGRDITERRRMEEAEREQRILAEALRDTSQVLSSSLDYGEVLDHILTAVSSVVPHDAATIMLIDGDVAHVVRSQGYQKRDPYTGVMEVRLPLTETTNLRQMFETRQPVVIHDTHSFPGWKRSSTTDWLRSNVGAPISIYGEVTGFILLDSETPDFFTPVHAERLEAFANQAALAIQNANLLKQAREEIAERKRAEEELRQSENRYRTVVESQTEFIVRWKPDGVRTFVNDAYCRYYGITPEQALSADFLHLVYEEDRPSVEEKIFRSLSGTTGAETDTHRVLKPDGTIGWCEWTDHAIYDENGQLIEFQSVGRDITERKRAEEALRESEALYRKAIEVAGAVPYYQSYYDHGRSIKYDFIGEGIRNITGYGPEEFNAKLWDSLTEEANLVEDLAGYSLDEGIQRVRSGENPVWKCEYRIRDRDGKIHWVFEAAVELRDEHGVARGSIGTFQDITTRKQAEAELRASEERFRQLATNIEEAFWMTDARTGQELYISPAAATIWGHLVDEMLTDPDAFINSVLPDDKSHVLMALEKQRNGEKTEIEYRVQRGDGSIRWVWDRAFPIFDAHGKVSTLAGIAADVTERKLAEEKLRASEERYHSLFQHLVDGFALHEIITDDQGKPVDYRFLEINPAFEKLTGLRAEATLGRRVNEILPRVGNERFISIYGKVALTGEPIHFEEYSAPLGRYYEINAYSPRHGQFAITFEDITERKQAEANLRKLSRAVEQSASTIVITDIAGNIEYVNPKFTEITGFTFEEVMGKNPRILKSGHTSVEEYGRLWRTITAGEEWRGELFNRKKNGDLFWEQVTISPIQNEQGETTHFIAVKEDITQRKQSEAEIQRHLAELQAVYENGLAVGQLLEPHQIGERLIETFARHLSWHHVTIRLVRPETEALELIAFNLPDLNNENKAEVEHHFNEMIHKVGQGLSGWVVQTGTSLRTGQVHMHPQYISTEPGIESGLYMPLKVGERVIGVISVESEKPDAFSEQDERLLATLATQAAIAFENARLYQSAQQEISERERAQAALRASETHYRDLADSITEIMFELDQDLHYSHWNKASEMFSGITADNAIGQSMQDVFGESEDQSETEKIYRRVLSEQQAQTFETEVFPHGQRRILEINAYPSAHGVSVVARDITERRISEALQQKRIALMEYSARHTLNELMQRAIDEVSELTDSHIGFLHFVEADHKVIHMQAWSSETIQAMGRIEEKEMHYPIESAGVWADAVRQQRAIIHNDYESLPDKRGLPDGHVRIIRELVVPIMRDDRIAAVIGIGNRPKPYDEHDVEIMERFADYAWDIIERKQMESALSDERNQLATRVDERTADLSRANSNLARALRVKDEFLANMSHELRTPLNAILGLSESLSEQVAGPLNEKQQKYLNTINESGHHLLSLINDILDLAKIEAGQISLDINKVDVNSVCQASLRMIKQLAQKKNQEVLFEIDNGLGLMWADERRLKQMIVNLLSNAVKFTPENGKLGLEVHGDQAGNRVLITVWDRGIGIGSQDLDRLFKPFVQLDSSLAREAAGTGLGLALVAQMARLHGGSVTVDSQIGAGSRFTIQLPWEPALAADVRSHLRTTGKFRAIDVHAKNKPTILLIEDTREVVMMLADYLEMAGFTIATAQDGIDGLEQAKLKHPDLILMDIQMPRMDGFETTQKLRLIPEFRETPIIALTALAMPNDRERCLEAGMSEYISKPVNLKMLLKLIRGILYEKEGNST